MQRFKKISTSGRKLTKTLLILLCFILPEQILYWKLCTDQDRNILANTEVIVSACKRPSVIGVPGGEVLFVHEGLTDKMYLLDLHTGEKRKVPNDPFLPDKDRVVFLNPELAWFERRGSNSNYPNYSPDYILDLTDGQHYELLDLLSLPRLEGNNFNPAIYSYIQSADRVFIDLSKNRLIALSTDFHTNQNGRVILSGFTISTDDEEILPKLVKSLDMDYENVDFSLRSKFSSTPSPTGKYVVRRDGIYLSKTNKKLATPYMSYYFRSWYYDESGVVVHDGYGTYWILTQFFGDYYHLSYPVLKLRLPIP